MTVEQVIGLTLALLIMTIGCFGSFVPLIPGPPLVLVGAIAHKLYFGPHSAPVWLLVGLSLLAALSLLLDSVASSLGARKLGATWRGMVGAVVGGLIGLFFGLPGILLGPFMGAMAFELISGRDFENSTRAGTGAVLGLIAGALGKFIVCLVMIGLFCFSVVYRSGAAT
jgi:uncharacterized protein YqgC (DUF456 family)